MILHFLQVRNLGVAQLGPSQAVLKVLAGSYSHLKAQELEGMIQFLMYYETEGLSSLLGFGQRSFFVLCLTGLSIGQFATCHLAPSGKQARRARKKAKLKR